jgi:hypothetical protein
MRSLAAVVLTVAFLFTGNPVPASADDAADVAAAQRAAQSWLSLTDGGKYADSWEQSAGLFRNAITKPAWEAAANAARSPLGKLESRALASATPAHALPGVPDGDYVVLQYTSRFEHKASATETVTPMREKDGTWKVSGYYIK